MKKIFSSILIMCALFVLVAPFKFASAQGFPSKTCSEASQDYVCLDDGVTNKTNPYEPTTTECCACLAQSENGKSLACYTNDVTAMLANIVIPLLFLIVFVLFIYGIVQYVYHGGDKTKRAEGQKYMIWGIVGMFVMVSVWGLVNVLSSTFSLKNTQPDIPTFEINQ